MAKRTQLGVQGRSEATVDIFKLLACLLDPLNLHSARVTKGIGVELLVSMPLTHLSRMWVLKGKAPLSYRYLMNDRPTSTQSYIFKVEYQHLTLHTHYAIHNVCPWVGFLCVMMLHFENVRLGWRRAGAHRGAVVAQWIRPQTQSWGPRFKSVGSGSSALGQGTLSALPSPLGKNWKPLAPWLLAYKQLAFVVASQIKSNYILVTQVLELSPCSSAQCRQWWKYVYCSKMLMKSIQQKWMITISLPCGFV